MDELKLIIKTDLNDVNLMAITEINTKCIIEGIEQNEININGYRILTKNFMLPKFRGIACYIRNHLNSTLIDLKTNFNEFLCVKINCLFLLIIYRSPHSDLNNNQHLITLLEEFLKFRGQKIILGDFNLPTIDWNQLHSRASDKSFENLFLQFRGSQKMNILIEIDGYMV